MTGGSGGSQRKIGNTRDQFQGLFDVYWPIGLGIFLVITALVVFVVIRFRSDERDFPGGRDESRAEWLYAAVVALIVTVLVIATFSTMDEQSAAVDGEVADGPLVEVTAARWNWRFEYPEHGIVVQGTKEQTPTLVVPVDTPVRFRQTSIDVIHSFWIPDLRFKRDAFPDRTTAFALTFPDEGRLRDGGQCAEFCGLDHAGMTFDVQVVGQAEYRDWVEERS